MTNKKALKVFKLLGLKLKVIRGFYWLITEEEEEFIKSPNYF